MNGAVAVSDRQPATKGTARLRRTTTTCLALFVVIGTACGPEPLGAQQVSGTGVPSPPDAPAEGPPDWLFPTDALDQALPSWIRIGGEYRSRFEGPSGIGYADISDSYLLSRLRVRATLEPEPWLLLHGEVQDARIFFNQHIPSTNPYQDTWTAWEGYVQVGNSAADPLDVLIGRQALAFGDERVIGPSDWLNVGRTFNVGRLAIHQPDYTISAFASSVVPGDNAELHGALASNNLYGVYASFRDVIPEATFEPYVLWRLAPANAALPETVDRGHLDEVTVGLHLKGRLPANFDYDTEFDWQTGSLGPSSINAWAGYVGIGRTLANLHAQPRVFMEGNYASGTKNPAGRQWTTFDQIYPSNHDKYGFADQVGRRNLEQLRVGVEEQPANGWKLKQAVASFWLATSNDNFYASSGAISVSAHPGASRHIGTELDLVAEYLWSKGLTFGFGYARLFAGEFLKATTAGHDYVFPYAYFEYNFSRSANH